MAAEMGVGLSEGGGLWITRTTLKGYLMKQGKGLIAAPILAPLMMLLNQAATWSPWAWLRWTCWRRAIR